MGRKPADRKGQQATSTSFNEGFDSGVPCGCCGAASRVVRPQWRACSNGHRFIRKSDHRVS